MDRYTYRIIATQFPMLAAWIIENNWAGYVELIYMALYGIILLTIIYLLTNSFNQYVALVAMVTWAIANTAQTSIFLGGMLWAAVLVLIVRILTSRSTGKFVTPEFAVGRKVELEPLVPVVVGLTVLGTLLIPKERLHDPSHSFFALAVVLLMYMFIKTMGGVEQHANIYSIIPLILIFALCLVVLPLSAEIFHGLVKFQPHIYVQDENEEMTPVGYFGGLFDTLAWFEGSSGKLGFVRLVISYAFMSCMALDEVAGPTAKFKAAITYFTKLDRHDSMVPGLAGNFNSIWLYSILIEVFLSLVAHSYVRMSGSITGMFLGYGLQSKFLTPIWCGRGVQHCLSKLRANMSFCLGDAFQGGRRLILRMASFVLIVTYMLSGQFDQMLLYLFLGIVVAANDRFLIGLMGFMGGNWTLMFLGIATNDPLMASAEDNSQINVGVPEAGGNSGTGISLEDITDVPIFMLDKLKKGKYLFKNRIKLTLELAKTLSEKEVYIPLDLIENDCEAELEISEGIHGEIAIIMAVSLSDHVSRKSKDKRE